KDIPRPYPLRKLAHPIAGFRNRSSAASESVDISRPLEGKQNVHETSVCHDKFLNALFRRNKGKLDTIRRGVDTFATQEKEIITHLAKVALNKVLDGFRKANSAEIR